MPHERARQVLGLILKRYQFWPVLGLLGARQTGKSTLFRDQVVKNVRAKYLTLDQKDLREQANKHPTLFLDQYDLTKTPLIIDEVQKAPDLFDAIKQNVDENRRPGKFLLTGSVDFSRKAGIRESLTGRIGTIRLYPLTLSECLGKSLSNSWLSLKVEEKKYSLAEVTKRLHHGGLPGICFMRSDAERKEAFSAWLDTTCFRDLLQIKGVRLSGELAYEILEQLCILDEPTVVELAKKLKINVRKITTHLEALETLFVVQKVLPDSLGVGKTRYFIFDSGLATHLGANLKRQMQIWLLHECLAQHEYSGQPERVKYYMSRKKSYIDFILEKNRKKFAYIVTDEESVSTYTLRTAEAFIKKEPQSFVTIIAPCQSVLKINPKIVIRPLGDMA